jgi:hypothetical protein
MGSDRERSMGGMRDKGECNTGEQSNQPKVLAGRVEKLTKNEKV